MRVYSFPRGGLSFEDTSVPSRDSSTTAFLPVLSIFPLAQPAGGRAFPVVLPGDPVKEGMLIGRAAGSGGVNVHATVPGRVLRGVSWKDVNGRSIDVLVIRMEGGFERLGKREEIFPWGGMGIYELQRVIADYGVVEMEDSGRPVSEMISAFRSAAEPLTLAVRCVFDDPWLAADYALCKERLKAVVEGAFIAARAAGKVSKILFAVSCGEKDLGEALLAEAAHGDVPAFLVLTGSRYPQWNRRELELVLRNYAKKENIELGSVLALGPASCAAVHDAVKLKKTALDRYVAVGGSAVRHPKVIKARIGMRLADLFTECGGFIEEPRHIGVGSPLSGRAVTDLNEPLLKTSYAVFAAVKGDSGGRQHGCISCGECRAVCPVALDPEEMYKQAVNARTQNGADMCHGCGCCEVVCPSHLPLSQVILGQSRGKAYD